MSREQEELLSIKDPLIKRVEHLYSRNYINRTTQSILLRELHSINSLGKFNRKELMFLKCLIEAM